MGQPVDPLSDSLQGIKTETRNTAFCPLKWHRQEQQDDNCCHQDQGTEHPSIVHIRNGFKHITLKSFYVYEATVDSECILKVLGGIIEE